MTSLYGNGRGKHIFVIVGAALLASFVLSLAVGKYPLTLANLLAGDAATVRVFVNLRLPRACMALLGGFGLGAAGFVYQTVFRNPLASPDIIGVSSGASAGAAFAILFIGASALPVTLAAFAGGLLAVLLTLSLATLAPGRSNTSVVLSGVAVHSLAQTLLMALKLTADPEKQLASIEYWTMGSLNGVSLDKLPMTLAICALGLIGLFALQRQTLMLSLDESEAGMLGVPVGLMRVIVLLLATLVVASVISVTGLISFIALLAPHIARRLIRDNRAPALWLSGFMGALILCGADILARSVADSELPVSIFTSLLGAPFLIYLLKKGDGRA